MSVSAKSASLFRTFIPLVALLFVLLAGAFNEARCNEKKTGLLVTIQAFSGRPNPTYLIEEKTEESESFIGMIRAARVNDKFEKDTVIPSILGYKGIVIESSGDIAEIAPFIAVYRGNIEVRNKTKKFLVDEDGALENFLLNQALKRKAIDEKVLDFIRFPVHGGVKKN